ATATAGWSLCTARRASGASPRWARSASCAEPFLQEQAERVGLVLAEGRAIAIAGAAVERERFGLVDARLQSQGGDAFESCPGFYGRQEGAPETGAARRGIDVHALHFAVAVGHAQRAAGDGHAGAPRDEEADLRPRKLVEIEEVIAGRRVKRAEIAVERADQLRHAFGARALQLDRHFPGRADSS